MEKTANVSVTIKVDDRYEGLCSDRCHFLLFISCHCVLFNRKLSGNGDPTSDDVCRCDQCLHTFGGAGLTPKK